MPSINITLRFLDSVFPFEVDTDETFEVLSFQIYSLTLVPPEKQKLIGISEQKSETLLSELNLIDGQELKLIESNDDPTSPDSTNLNKTENEKTETFISSSSSSSPPSTLKSDEELARLLQEEEYKASAPFMQDDQASHSFLARLQSGYNSVMQYEKAKYQAKALSVVPVDQLEEQAAIFLTKNGKDLTEDEMKDAFLIQLLKWFKGWFSWVDSLPCEVCARKTRHFGSAEPTLEDLRFEGNRVEIHRCDHCSISFRFVRYNDPTKLLETRKGRCGEWANCFTLICRSLGYDARKVEDWTDHVWTECYSKKLSRWVHLDPCESAFDEPLLYEKGWNKKLSYIFAFSNEGIKDVIFRYTRKWNELKHRRNILPEDQISKNVSILNTKIFSSLSKSRLEFLTQRNFQEDSELHSYLSEKDKTDVHLPGRITGSLAWRTLRGETGPSAADNDKKENEPGEKNIDNSTKEKYACDDHVGKIRNVLSDICNHVLFQEKKTDEYENPADLFLRVLKCASYIISKMKSQPFKFRQLTLDSKKSNAEYSNFDFEESFSRGKLAKFCECIGISVISSSDKSSEKDKIILNGRENFIQLALSIPFSEHTLNSVTLKMESMKKMNQKFSAKGIFWAADRKKIFGGFVSASSENLPNESALNAFDGMDNSKWLHHDAIKKKAWIMYEFKNNFEYKLCCYFITSADDCPSRDPSSWILEGSSDGGVSWKLLDSRKDEKFEKRFGKRKFDIEPNLQVRCNAWRWTFLKLNDVNESILQLASIDMYAAKEDIQNVKTLNEDSSQTKSKDDQERKRTLFAHLCKEEFEILTKEKRISANEAAKLAFENATRRLQLIKFD